MNFQTMQQEVKYICEFVKIPQLNQVRRELQYATALLQDHKLYQSAKWSGELLIGISKQSDIAQGGKEFVSISTDYAYKFEKQYYPDYSSNECDILLVAKSLFDLREFKKCASMLKDVVAFAENQQAIFLYYYSLYLYGEMKKEEEMFENDQNPKMAVNREIRDIERELGSLFINNQLNEMNLYLYGVILKQLMRNKEAKEIFIQVLHVFPCFWSAWLELCKISQEDDGKQLMQELPNHWMKNLYYASFSLEKFKNTTCVEILNNLLYFFVNSNFLLNQIANAFYNNQEFDSAQEWFERLLKIDPYRYESLDTYSNILYIKENQSQLANLALQAFSNNKYVPETCCVVGNYYSLMNDHAKAITYFQKALKLDKDCLAAWTLMGHEYLEMKNSTAAINSYRNAVEIDPKDFRAWYGLGQTYELQNMNQYALYYFSRAVISRPMDARMWNAMGNCYQRIEKLDEAGKCFERAYQCKDKEGISLTRLGHIYDALGQTDKAILAFEESVRRKDEDELIDKELGEILLYLARIFRKKGYLEKATWAAKRLYDFNGPERDEAHQILSEINGGQVMQNISNLEI